MSPLVHFRNTIVKLWINFQSWEWYPIPSLFCFFITCNDSIPLFCFREKLDTLVKISLKLRLKILFEKLKKNKNKVGCICGSTIPSFFLSLITLYDCINLTFLIILFWHMLSFSITQKIIVWKKRKRTRESRYTPS